MARYVALLRAVNLGSHSKVSMKALKTFVGELSFTDVGTLLNSGNVTFTAGQEHTAVLEALLESEAEKRLGLKTDFMVRAIDELAGVIAANPFQDMARKDPSHLVVMFLKDAPKTAAVAALQKAIVGPELVRAGDRHVYISYPAGIGTSKLTNAVIETKLGTRGTGRNWNTVLKLSER